MCYYKSMKGGKSKPYFQKYIQKSKVKFHKKYIELVKLFIAVVSVFTLSINKRVLEIRRVPHKFRTISLNRHYFVVQKKLDFGIL